MPKLFIRTSKYPLLLLIPSIVLTCFQCLTVCARAQTAAASPTSILRTEFMGQRFILRNLSGAEKIHASWDGHSAKFDAPLYRILATLTVNKIQLKSTDVKIEATRNQLLRYKTGKLGLSSIDTPVTLTLTLDGDPATLAPTLRNAIFFPSLDAAVAAVPKNFQDKIPPQPDAVYDLLRRVHDYAGTTGSCQAGMKPPKVLHSVDPELSDEAKQNKINGSVEVGIRIDETGAIADEWVVREIGHGLDEEAAVAVSQYKFAPATCNGNPIGVTILIGVNFQIR